MSDTAASTLTPAVLHCWTTYEQTYAIASGKGVRHDEAHQQAATAYRDAIPCIAGLASIPDFIACVTHGMVLQIIPIQEGTRLLYAANVAAGAFRLAAKESQKVPQTDASPKLQAA